VASTISAGIGLHQMVAQKCNFAIFRIKLNIIENNVMQAPHGLSGIAEQLVVTNRHTLLPPAFLEDDRTNQT